MYLKISLISTLFIFAVSTASGQDLDADLKLIADAIESAKSVAIEAEVHMYSRKNGPKVYTAGGALYKSGQSVLNTIGGYKSLQTSKYYVQVDEEERIMLVLDRSKTDRALEKKMPEMDVRELRKLYAEKDSESNIKITLVSASDGRKKYKISGVSGVVEVEIELDITKKALVMVSYSYDNELYSGQYVVVNYSKFLYDSDLESHFNPQNYFVVQNSKIIPAKKYTGYKIYTEL